jgi:hypothetical protein
MSVTEIIQKIHELSPEDRETVRRELDGAERWADDMTPEMIAAVEEGLRSAREEPTYTIEELRVEMRTWTLDSD